MKKLVSVIAGIMVIGTMLGGCGSAKLADIYDSETVESTAKQAVDALNEEDYDSVTAMVRSDLQESLSAEVLSDALAKSCPDKGAFNEYKDAAVVGQKNKAGDDIAVAVVIAAYENQKVQYTISFDENMEIVGFYMK